MSVSFCPMLFKLPISLSFSTTCILKKSKNEYNVSLITNYRVRNSRRKLKFSIALLLDVSSFTKHKSAKKALNFYKALVTKKNA